MIEGTYCNMFTSGVVPAAVGFFTIGAIALKDDDLEGEMSAIESWMRRCVGSRRECRYRGNGGWFYNWMFERELPYVWRNNSRCADGRFWDVLAEMMSVTNLGAFPLLVFHDGLGCCVACGSAARIRRC